MRACVAGNGNRRLVGHERAGLRNARTAHSDAAPADEVRGAGAGGDEPLFHQALIDASSFGQGLFSYMVRIHAWTRERGGTLSQDTYLTRKCEVRHRAGAR